MRAGAGARRDRASGSSTTARSRFTPDNQFVLGEPPGLGGYFVGAGLQLRRDRLRRRRRAGRWRSGSSRARPRTRPGRGRHPALRPFHGNPGGCRRASPRCSACTTPCPGPTASSRPRRPFRRSPLHDRLAARGRVYGSKMGWERAELCSPPPGESTEIGLRLGQAGWLALIGRRAARLPRIGRGLRPDVVLEVRRQRARTPRVTAVGLRQRRRRRARRRRSTRRCSTSAGGYQSDLTVTRVGPREFLLVSSSATTGRDQDWIRRHLPAGSTPGSRDVTTAYAVLGVMGPRSRDLYGG